MKKKITSKKLKTRCPLLCAQAAFTTSVRGLKNQNQQRSHQGSNHFTAPATSAPKTTVLHLSWSSLSTLYWPPSFGTLSDGNSQEKMLLTKDFLLCRLNRTQDSSNLQTLLSCTPGFCWSQCPQPSLLAALPQFLRRQETKKKAEGLISNESKLYIPLPARTLSVFHKIISNFIHLIQSF